MEQNHDQSLFDMNMDSTTQSHLLSISKWAKFISITGFVTGGLFIILLAALGSEIIDKLSSLLSLGDTDKNLTGALIAIVVVVLVIGCWLFFLFRASTLLKKGVQSRDTALLAEGFKAMRSYFIFSFVMSLLSILSTLQSFA